MKKIQETIARTENFEKIKGIKLEHRRRLEDNRTLREAQREEQRKINLDMKTTRETRIKEAQQS